MTPGQEKLLREVASVDRLNGSEVLPLLARAVLELAEKVEHPAMLIDTGPCPIPPPPEIKVGQRYGLIASPGKPERVVVKVQNVSDGLNRLYLRLESGPFYKGFSKYNAGDALRLTEEEFFDRQPQEPPTAKDERQHWHYDYWQPWSEESKAKWREAASWADDTFYEREPAPYGESYPQRVAREQDENNKTWRAYLDSIETQPPPRTYSPRFGCVGSACRMGELNRDGCQDQCHLAILEERGIIAAPPTISFKRPAPFSPPTEKSEPDPEFAEVEEAQGTGGVPPESDPHSRACVREELAQIVTKYPSGGRVSPYDIADRILDRLMESAGWVTTSNLTPTNAVLTLLRDVKAERL